MLKFFMVTFVSILFSTYLSASLLHEKIENIIGEKNYKIHNKLIHLLFKNESLYMSREQIKYYKLFDTLQKNGLLNLHLNKPKEIEIEFIGLNKNFKAYKILNDTMQSLGYRYFFTKSMNTDDQKRLIWNIVFKVEYMLDPVMLIKELKKNRCVVKKVFKNSSKKWTYEIDFQNAELSNAIKIDKNEKVSFGKPLRAYMIKISDAQSLQIISRNLNNWFPHVVFFDKDLYVLDVIKKDYISKGLKVKIPNNTKYIKITDMYNLINIKRGLSIIVR